MPAPDEATVHDQWVERDAAVVWHGFTQMSTYAANRPVIVERAEGRYLIDVAGRRYLDAISSLWLTTLGHHVPELDEAARAQLDRVAHSTLLGNGNRAVIELAEALAPRLPVDEPHLLFGSDGSSAVEQAVKVAFQYWTNQGVSGRDTFLTFGDAYHGDTIGMISVGAGGFGTDVFDPLRFPVLRTPSLGEPGALPAALAAVEQHAHQLAAVIVEPLVQGAAGMLLHSPEALAALAEACRRHDVLLICDEVATGFGRTGTLFAVEQAGVRPDLLCLGKGITGGYLPLSAVAASGRVYDAFLGPDLGERTFYHGHSYAGNAVAAAVARRHLELLDEGDVLANVNARAAQLGRRLDETIAGRPEVAAVRRCGLMAGIELAPPTDGLRWGRRVSAACVERGVLIRPLGDVVVVMPPLTTTEAEIDLIVDTLAAALDEACTTDAPTPQAVTAGRATTATTDPAAPSPAAPTADPATAPTATAVTSPDNAAATTPSDAPSGVSVPSWHEGVGARLADIRRQGRWRAPRSFDAFGPAGVLEAPAGAPTGPADAPPPPRQVVSFASNDYLGLSSHPAVIAAAHTALDRWGTGAGASRLVVGNRPVHDELEAALAEWKHTERAVVFPTGFATNVGVLTALAAAAPGGQPPLLCSDELNHASLIDGARLARAEVAVFPHRDLDALEELLQRAHRARRAALVATDTVFSMDGDHADVEAVLALAARYDALVVLDEAHAVYGSEVPDPDPDGPPVVRVGTLSKTLGALGGFAATNADIADLLVNSARSYIFTTALAPADAAAALAALHVLRSSEGDDLVARLRRYVERLAPGHPSPIIPIVLGDEARAVAAADRLAAAGLLVPAIRPPTVAAGTARLRVTLSAAHTDDQVERLAAALADLTATP